MHTEAFSFTNNGYQAYPYPTQESWGTPVDLVPVGPRYQTDSAGRPVGDRYADPLNDAYALVPIELDWRKVGGVAYHNRTTGLKITHFPAIHCRRGSISYKVEWTPPGSSEKLSMIYSGDTKPNYTMIEQSKGVDILIHEMVVPPDVWLKIARLPHHSDSSKDHRLCDGCPEQLAHDAGCIRHLLSRIIRPRLTIAPIFRLRMIRSPLRARAGPV